MTLLYDVRTTLGCKATSLQGILKPTDGVVFAPLFYGRTKPLPMKNIFMFVACAVLGIVFGVLFALAIYVMVFREIGKMIWAGVRRRRLTTTD